MKRKLKKIPVSPAFKTFLFDVKRVEREKELYEKATRMQEKKVPRIVRDDDFGFTVLIIVVVICMFLFYAMIFILTFLQNVM